jgi:hypothetical protein
VRQGCGTITILETARFARFSVATFKESYWVVSGGADGGGEGGWRGGGRGGGAGALNRAGDELTCSANGSPKLSSGKPGEGRGSFIVLTPCS